MPAPSSTLPALALTLLVSASAPAAAAERWTHHSDFTGIVAVADAGDHLWLGTRGGLIRVDKATGEKAYFNQGNSALTDSRILTLDGDGNGRIVATTLGGALVEFDGATWSNPGLLAPFRGQRVIDVAWGPESALWVLARDEQSRLPSLFLRRNARWSRHYLENVDPVSIPGVGSGRYTYTFGYQAYLGFRLPSVQADGKGGIWASVQFRGEPKVYHVGLDGAVDSVAAPTHLGPRQFVASRSGGGYWICMLGLAWSDSLGWNSTGFPSGTYPHSHRTAHPRYALARDADGSEIWTLPQPYRRREGVWEAIAPSDDSAWFDPLVLEARAGGRGGPQVYLAGGNRLAMRVGEAWCVTDPARISLGIGVLKNLVPGPGDGREMLIGGSAEVLAFDGEAARFTPLGLPSTWGRPVIGLGSDRRGGIWLSGPQALGRLVPEGAESLPLPDGRWTGYQGTRRLLAEDAAGTSGTLGNIWLADSNRLIAVPRGSSAPAWKSHALPAPWDSAAYIVALAAHPDSSIWVAVFRRYAYARMLARFSRGRWTVFPGADLPGQATDFFSDVRCDGAGNVWATSGQGILQWDGTAWKQHDWASHAAISRGIDAITVDGSGTLWAATSPPEASLLRWAGGWQAVAGAQDGMRTTLVRAMEFDGAGRLWMATADDGLLVYDPAGTASTRLPSLPGNAIPTAARASLAPRGDGSWEVRPGPRAGAGGLFLRVLDLNGREASREVALRPAREGRWIWSGPGRQLAPGRYLLSLQGPEGRLAVLPFHHGRP